MPRPLSTLLCFVAALVLLGLASAQAASLTVPSSGLDMDSRAVTASSLRPPQCAALGLTSLVAGDGTITGTPGSDLILGSAGIDIIDGGGGDDCILGGGGADSIDGGLGDDVCLGGGGEDAITCEDARP
ncbi:hypothetical protein F8S13_11695 [Chloroflexia bacterium SDU3-3]|nr:hypothetical protein F8S13_11695 [Chloroflexia bacterium SDU3-3]